MPITTAMCTSFKVELLQGGHCFNATQTPTGDTTNSSTTISNMSAVTNLVVGMPISGTNIPAGAKIVTIPSSTSVTISAAATGTASGTTLTCTGDVFKIALIKVGMAGTYGAATTNYSDITGNSDEVTGTGYTAGGVTLTNVTPSSSGTTALTTFSPNPTWTSATFSTTGAMIYNSTGRLSTTGRACSVHDFGGTQTVSSGTFTAVMPSAGASTAILRLS